jgi:hypothetical protein
MPRCPNCARETMRTIDWACMWCGYPLMSRAFKKIDKTYKQLQEERRLGLDETESENESESEVESEPELEEPVRKTEPMSHSSLISKFRPKPQQPQPEEPEETASEPEEEPESEPEREPVKPRVIPRREMIPPRRSVPEIKPELPVPAPRMEPVANAEPKIEMIAGTKAEVISEPENKAPQASQPEPEPVAPPNLDAISAGVKISVDQLNVLFQSDSAGTNAKLRDKVLTISGIVEKVFVRDHLDIRYIMMTGTRKPTIWKFRCSFGKESVPQISRLAEGQPVVVQGKYDGYSKNVILKDCILSE